MGNELRIEGFDSEESERIMGMSATVTGRLTELFSPVSVSGDEIPGSDEIVFQGVKRMDLKSLELLIKAVKRVKESK